MSNYDPLVDAIAKVRVRNNDSWIQILKIALDVDPKRTMKALEQIIDNDTKVISLAKAILAGGR